MTTVGIVGGLGPESTIDYYRRILAATTALHVAAIVTRLR
jgi:aspartate/glutamate racemase